MKMNEAGEKYHIPLELLKMYESWGLNESGKTHCDDHDLECLSMMMTLKDSGFCHEEIGTYMHLLEKGPSTAEERLRMLDQKRRQTLEEIHMKEKQVERLDYLRHKLRTN